MRAAATLEMDLILVLIPPGVYAGTLGGHSYGMMR